ncbi:MAG: hypothetical protein IJF53_02830 [Clostridia bacterium]|nr:hypothetical protein [Clostridia bacterium]
MDILSNLLWIFAGATFLGKEANKEMPGCVLMFGIVGGVVLLCALGISVGVEFLFGSILEISLFFFGGISDEFAYFVYFNTCFALIIWVFVLIHMQVKHEKALEAMAKEYDASFVKLRKYLRPVEKRRLIEEKKKEYELLVEYLVPSWEQMESSFKWKNLAKHGASLRDDRPDWTFLPSFNECLQDAQRLAAAHMLYHYENMLDGSTLFQELKAWEENWRPPSYMTPTDFDIKFYEDHYQYYLKRLEKKHPSLSEIRRLKDELGEGCTKEEVFARWRNDRAIELAEQRCREKKVPLKRDVPVRAEPRHEELAAQALQDSDEPKRKYRRKRLNQNNSTDP